MSSMYLFVSCLQLKAGVEKCTQQTNGIEKVNLRYLPSGTHHPVPAIRYPPSLSPGQVARSPMLVALAKLLDHQDFSPTMGCCD